MAITVNNSTEVFAVNVNNTALRWVKVGGTILMCKPDFIATAPGQTSSDGYQINGVDTNSKAVQIRTTDGGSRLIFMFTVPSDIVLTHAELTFASGQYCAYNIDYQGVTLTIPRGIESMSWTGSIAGGGSLGFGAIVTPGQYYTCYIKINYVPAIMWM